MTETPTLLLRHGIFHFRRAVPVKLRPFLKKREHVESLHTKDKAEAKIRVKAIGIKVDRLFEAAWRKHFALAENPAALAKAWQQDILREDAEARALLPSKTKADLEAEIADLEGALSEARSYLTFGHVESLHESFLTVLERYGITLPPSSPLFRQMIHAFLRVGVETLQILRRRVSGDFTDEPPMQPEEKLDDAENPLLSVVLERWRHERQPPSQTWHEWQATFKRFRELVGSDLPVKSITRSHVRAFKDALLRAPQRMPHALRGRPFTEVLAQARRSFRDRECNRNRSRRVPTFLNRSRLAQCYFKGRNRSHNRINAALLTEDGHPNLPRNAIPEGHRFRHINDEMWLLALACDVVRLMLQQVSEILHVGRVVGVEELFRCL